MRKECEECGAKRKDVLYKCPNCGIEVCQDCYNIFDGQCYYCAPQLERMRR